MTVDIWEVIVEEVLQLGVGVLVVYQLCFNGRVLTWENSKIILILS